MSDQLEQRSSQPGVNVPRVSDVEPEIPRRTLPATTVTELLDLYDKIARTRPGTRDAEIFDKVRQWTFSNFSLPAHEFAGIPKNELDAWQKRNRINLSAGRIRPETIDLQRGYAWGQIRMTGAANRCTPRSGRPPPTRSSSPGRRSLDYFAAGTRR